MTDREGSTAPDESDIRLEAVRNPWYRRFRYWLMLFGIVFIPATMYYMDPDPEGFRTKKILLSLAFLTVLVFAAHVGRRGLFDYASMSRAWRVGLQSPEGAARLFQGVCMVVAALLLAGATLVVNAAPVEQPHPKSLQHREAIAASIQKNWPELPWPHYVPALISHESGCPGMRSCWEPTARLKTKREEGAGFPQLTRAYREDGSVRFDMVTTLANKYPALSGMNWGNVYQRPDYQITALALLARESWFELRGVRDPMQRLAMTDACYNGGCRDLHRERERCKASTGCNPQVWFGHVETKCVKSTKPLYGTRSACDINRHHVKDVLHRWMPVYRGYFS